MKELLAGKVFIIAEAGVNHNGRVDLACRLVDVAKAAGADAVKFQTFVTEKSISRHAELAGYQKTHLSEVPGQFEMAKQLELTFEEFIRIKLYCDQQQLMFLSTPDEEDSLEFLCRLGVPIIKIGSGEITNFPFLRAIARKHRPSLLSTGVSDLQEVADAMKVFAAEGHARVALLHCVSQYPAPAEESNLRAMRTLRDTFGVPVGFSDHTLGTELAVAAVALGAQILEKHFTLDKAMEGPDHQASLEPRELKALVQAIRRVESALGDGRKRPTPSELPNRDLIRKSLVARRTLKAGQVITPDDLILKKPGHGIPSRDWDQVVGRVLKHDLHEDELIAWEHLQ